MLEPYLLHKADSIESRIRRGKNKYIYVCTRTSFNIFSNTKNKKLEMKIFNTIKGKIIFFNFSSIKMVNLKMN